MTETYSTASHVPRSNPPRHPLDHAEAFLNAYLAGDLPRKLLSESELEMDRLNDLPSGAYVENIAGSQFDDK